MDVELRGPLGALPINAVPTWRRPAVVFGPGDIAQAHTKDEWVELAQVEKAAEILFRFAAG